MQPATTPKLLKAKTTPPIIVNVPMAAKMVIPGIKKTSKKTNSHPINKINITIHQLIV
jgi:hypothetical protein